MTEVMVSLARRSTLDLEVRELLGEVERWLDVSCVLLASARRSRRVAGVNLWKLDKF